jgi:hypothetical protein
MVYGYGPVAFATFAGFIVGYLLAKGQAAGGLISTVGLFSLIVGIVTMVTRRSPVIGVPGGLLTGFGLGATVATTF